MKLDESIAEVFLASEADGKLVGLVLVRAGHGVHAKLDDRVKRCEQHLVEHEANDNRLGSASWGRDGQAGVKAKRGKESLVVDEDGEDGEGEEEVQLGGKKESAWVGLELAQLPS